MARRSGRTVLAVYAHPDDAEIWAGGTLVAHRRAGDAVALCVLTHADGPRAVEAQRGAEALGARLHHLAFRDRALRADAETCDAVAEVLQRERPQIILTHWEGDSHPDHVATWTIVRSAILISESERDLQALFWSDTYNGAGISGHFEPDTLVDVSETWADKLAAIMAHTSQHPVDYVAMTSRQCAIHGARGGATWAEGFRRVPLIGTARRARPTLWEQI